MYRYVEFSGILMGWAEAYCWVVNISQVADWRGETRKHLICCDADIACFILGSYFTMFPSIFLEDSILSFRLTPLNICPLVTGACLGSEASMELGYVRILVKSGKEILCSLKYHPYDTYITSGIYIYRISMTNYYFQGCKNVMLPAQGLLPGDVNDWNNGINHWLWKTKS